MVAIWVLTGVLIVVAILLGITIYFRFFKRKTVVGIVAEKVKELQDKDVKLEEELELRRLQKELTQSITTKQKKINNLIDGKE